MIKYKHFRLYWFLRRFEFLKVYFSPFKPFLPKLYIGKIAISTPVFYPRKWVKATPKLAHKAVEDYFKREDYYNTLNPNTARKIRPYEEVYKEKIKHSYPVPKRIGFDFVGLGWKTKFDSYRHETNPVWSFIAFGYQIAVVFVPDNDIQYWECFLAYHFETDRKASVEIRLKSCIKRFPCVWRSSFNGVEAVTDYWPIILKKKWRNILF